MKWENGREVSIGCQGEEVVGSLIYREKKERRCGTQLVAVVKEYHVRKQVTIGTSLKRRKQNPFVLASRHSCSDHTTRDLQSNTRLAWYLQCLASHCGQPLYRVSCERVISVHAASQYERSQCMP